VLWCHKGANQLQLLRQLGIVQAFQKEVAMIAFHRPIHSIMCGAIAALACLAAIVANAPHLSTQSSLVGGAWTDQSGCGCAFYDTSYMCGYFSASLCTGSDVVDVCWTQSGNDLPNHSCQTSLINPNCAPVNPQQAPDCGSIKNQECYNN
jgi:hypothetical protein